MRLRGIREPRSEDPNLRSPRSPNRELFLKGFLSPSREFLELEGLEDLGSIVLHLLD